MNLNQVKAKLYDLTDKFFEGAAIIWTEQGNTLPKLPYVTLRTGSLNKTLFPVEDDGSRYYHCETVLEVNLYTQGKPVTIEECVTSSYENTVVSDLMEFVLFLESPEMVDKIANDGMDIQLMQNVRDLSELINDNSYRYRAMSEFTVTFVEKVSGRFNLSGDGIADTTDIVENASGGGTVEQRKAKSYTIKRVTVKEDTKNGK